MAVVNKNQGLNKKKKTLFKQPDGSFAETQFLTEAQKADREALRRTKDTNDSQLRADEIMGGSPEQLRERDRLDRIKQMEFESSLLNATPGQQPVTTPAQSEVTSPKETQPATETTTAQNQDGTPSFIPTIDERIQQERQERGQQLQEGNPLGKNFIDAFLDVTELVGSYAQLINPLSESFFNPTAAKSAKQKKAEQAITDLNTAMSKNLELVSRGAKSYWDADKEVQKAIELIVDLEAETTYLNKLQLGHWVDEGAAIEAQISATKSTLELYRLNLLEAARTSFNTQQTQNG